MLKSSDLDELRGRFAAAFEQQSTDPLKQGAVKSLGF
jgi:hypothetical protein